MEEREQILNGIEKFNVFLIPSRREVFSIACDVTKLTNAAKELYKEGLIDWSVYFSKTANAVVLMKSRELDYNLTDGEKKRMLDKLEKTGYYVLSNRKSSKVKKWGDRLYFLKTLAKEGKLDWHIDFKTKKYLFRKI